MSVAITEKKSSGSSRKGFRPIDPNREDFRRYLEKEGILESLTKALVKLYEEPEKPANALQYLKNYMADRESLLTELEACKEEVKALKSKLKELEAEVETFKSEKSRGSEYPPDMALNKSF